MARACIVEEESACSFNENDQSSKSTAATFTSTEEVTLFHHRREVGRLISNLLMGDPAVSEVESSKCNDGAVLSFERTDRCKSLAQLRRILDEYLENPSVLDPFLEELLVYSTLMDRIRQIVHAIFVCHCSTTFSSSIFHMVSHTIDKKANHSECTRAENQWQPLPFLLSVVYMLSKVSGRKKVQRFFPHDASDVEPVLYALRNYESIITITITATANEDGAPQFWETCYVLLLWMGMLSYVPFALTTIDSFNSSGSNSYQQEGQKSLILLVDSILNTAQDHLKDSGPTREAAAACLAEFLIRRDLSSNHLSKFITRWSRENIVQLIDPSDEATPTCSSSTFLTMGVLQTLANIFKLAPERSDLLHCLESLWEPLILLSQINSNNTTLRKLVVKLFARVGCAYLPPKVAPWRYQRGRRNILENLADASQPTVVDNKIDSNNKDHSSTVCLRKEWQQIGDNNNEVLGLVDIVATLEDVMDQLLLGLRDRATVVRWSAAKGIGRVTERLPMICADDVVEALYGMCDSYEQDNAWHGACLALAELARRGLLLPHRLHRAVSIVTAAMQYDIRKGQHSVGSHVRDAACYACWAFARAYSPSTLTPHIPELIQSMVITSLFDREINCRRAASAAFQECVGRQGGQNVHHGIDILTTADYFSLGNRSYSYTTAACFVARFDPYRIPIIDHLSTVKLFHWDIQIRVLSSKALHDMAVSVDCAAADYMKSAVLPRLLPLCMSDDLYLRHGAVLGVAEIMLGLGKLRATNAFDNTIAEPIAALVPSIEKARLYRGRGGEIMRAGVCRLIECISLSCLTLPVKDQVRMLDSVDSNLKHPKEDVQQAAVGALHALTRSYFPVGIKGPSQRLQNRIVDTFVKIILSDNNAAATRGYSLALGSLPSKLLAPNEDVLSKVIECLCAISRPGRKVGGESDAETRRNAIRSLVQVCRTVGFSETERSETPQYPLAFLSKAHVQLVFASLLESMGDYGIDHRGDVGSWSRIEAMIGLEEVLYMAINASPTIPHIAAPIIAGHSKNHSQHELMDIPDITSRLSYFEENAAAKVKQSLSDGKCFQPFGLQSEDFLVDETLCTRIIGAMLKQLCEKMDLVRSVAGGCLERLLLSTSPVVTFIPQKIDLLTAMNLDPYRKKEGDILTNNYAIPSITFPMVIRAMNIDEFFQDIISGIVISVGGISESVVKFATSSLLEWVKILRQRKSAAGIAKLGNALLHVFRQHQREERVTLPLLKTLDKLFLNGTFEALLESKTSSFPENLLSLLKSEAAGCSSVPRLLSMVNVALALVNFESNPEVRQNVLLFALELLGHSYPRVRRYTAEQLYVKLLEEYSSFMEENEHHETVLNLLLEVAWDDDFDPPGCVRVHRNRVAELMNLDLSCSMKETRKPKHETNSSDEFDSYKSLVKDAGR